VDTYNSLDGVRHAIDVARELRGNGHEMIGVRLDSGDRVALSIETRRMLDKAGFPSAKIVCSGDLDEHVIADLKRRGAKIDMWGVGTKLTTGQPDAALGGIYKLGAVHPPGRQWQYRIKLSDEPAKTSYPGLLQVWRFCQRDGRFIADAIYEIDHGIGEPCVIVDPETNEPRIISDACATASVGEAVGFPRDGNVVPYSRPTQSADLLAPIFRDGRLVYDVPTIETSRERARTQLSCAPPEILRLDKPRPYKVGLEKSLHELRSTLIALAKEQSN
jgi:nicotinate phosphoribosyltransferase